MRKMWKRALAGVLTASMALSLAACGGSSSNGGSSADGSTTLEVWSSNLSDSQRENVKKLVAQYDEQTGVKIYYTEFSYDRLHDNILCVAAGGKTADAQWISGIPQHGHSGGYVRPLHKLGQPSVLAASQSWYVHRDESSVCRTNVVRAYLTATRIS